MYRYIKPIAAGSLLGLGLLLTPPLDAVADDTVLFTARVTPNVLLMIDNSNSMNEIMEHPSYDRNAAPFSCNILPTATSGSGTINDDNSVGTPYRCTIIGCFFEFDNTISGFTPTSSSSDDAETGYITRRFCGQTRRLYHDGGLTNIGGVSTNDNKTRWLEPYTEWYFSIDTGSSTTYPPDTQTAADIVADVDDSANGRHYIDGTYYGLFQRARITGAREIATDVIYQTNTDCPPYLGDCGVYEDNIRFGLATFQGGSHGGYVSVPVDVYSAAQRTSIADTIYALDPMTNTPLAETLFKLYTYFMHRTDGNQRPVGAIDTGTRFPAYSYRTSDGANSATVPLDPVAQSCQKHFIIMITDGEPTSDDFATSGSDTNGFGDFKTRLVGNFAPDGGTDIDTPEEGSPPWASGGTGFLDDLAYFMQTRDMRLDMTGMQNVDTYTIGFDTYGIASALLAKTAARGNGLFAESSQSQELTDALVAAIDDILLKAQSFTAATVPASRTTSGDNLYSAFFVPVQNSPMWQGHLKDFDYTAAGDVLTADGTCAIGSDDSATPPCPASGELRTEANAFWDVAEEIPAPGSRKLYVELAATSMFAQPTTFTIPSPTSTAVTWFGLIATDNTSTPYSTLSPSGTTDMAQALIRFLRGCTFSNSSTCTTRMDVTGTRPQYFGDIFHSNPVVVGSPNAAINEGSYKTFATTYRQRPRVVYAGANDGYLHGFHAGAWNTTLNPDGHDRGTGQELMGFMPHGVRTTVKTFVKFSSGLRTQVLVDGSPIVADVWFNRNTVGTPPTSLATSPNPTLVTKHALQWRTVLIQSLRDGGQHYTALDITNPPASASTSTTTYPRYLWAFPAESGSPTNGATSSEATWVGNTWSDPVITRVRVKADSSTDTNSYERWVAIFGGGYNAAGDPNSTGYKTPAASGFTPKGRAIYMVDITTGKVLAKKHWDDATAAAAASPVRTAPTALSSATSEQVGIEELRYAIPSAPAVFDLDFDGFADVIYIGDLGGNLWKWVVDKPGQDPVNNVSLNRDMAQPDWPFRLFVRGDASNENGTSLPAELYGGTWSSAVHYQSFFFPPTGALRKGDLVLAFGAGERADPIGPTSRYNDGCTVGTTSPTATACKNNNHFYVVKDSDPRERVGTFPNRLNGKIVEDCSVHGGPPCVGEGDLANFDSPTPPTCAQMKATKVGFYLTSRDAEKFVTASTIFLGEVFTGSFFPADPSSVTICDSRGSSYLYRFDLDCGTGPTDTGDPQDDRREPIGEGLPTRPRVSVGDLNQGDTSGCINKIVVVTSDGSIWNDCPGSIPSSGVKVRSWRER